MRRLYPKVAWFIPALFLISFVSYGQQRTVSGVVTGSDENEPVPGVNVLLQGTTGGTVTNIEGRYSISVPNDEAVLVFSSVGYETQTVTVGNQSTLNVTLSSDLKQLNEVVVTALGIEREKKALGYSVEEIQGEALTEAREVNVANSLMGKVAGVQVNKSSSGVTGSTRVIIRGNSSLAGDNQPLYVVDGIPIDNSNRGAAGRWGGRDYGDGISNINPDDIETISVLKGPNAAALYGQRGANGVILITTKTGKSRKGIGVSLNTNLMIGNPLVLPDFQNQYGQGRGGNFKHYRRNSDDEVFTRDDALALDPALSGFTPQLSTLNDGVEGPVSWGAPMNGQNAYTWYGELLPYSPQPDNMRDFFDTETSLTNTLSLNGGNETTTFYFSASNLTYNGMLPTNDLTRNNITLRGTHQVNDKITIDAKVNYINQESQNRPGLSDAQENVAYALRYMPRNIRIQNLQKYEYTQSDFENLSDLQVPPGQQVEGWERHWSSGTFTMNPYWAINNARNEDSRERIIGLVRANFEITDWLSISGRAGTDFYTEQRFEYRALGTRVTQQGNISENVFRVKENNFDVLASAQKTFGDFDLSINLGAQRQYQFFRQVGYNGGQFNVPDLFVIGNTNNNNPTFGLSESAINSVYAFGQVGYKNILFLDWTARNDWSSNLAKENMSFFYPSLSGSFVWTDAFNLDSKVFSFGKLRASWAQAGASGNPYQIFGTYSLRNIPHDGQPLAGFTNTLPPLDLQNELTTSFEIGTDLRLFNNRIGLDFTYYTASTINQILSISVAPTSGFNSRRVNAGEIRNYGIELLLSATPIELDNGFSWDVSFNYASNNNEVVELVEGVETFQLGDDRNIRLFAEPGQPYAQIYTDVGRQLRDGNGNVLVAADGLPIIESGLFPIGNALPDWFGGFTNNLRFKNLSLSATLDIRQGGDIFSMSNVYEAIHGTTKRTLPGREGDLVVEGIVAEQNDAGEWVSTGQTNTTQVRAEDYWNRVVPGSRGAVGELFMNDGSFIALREVNLAFRLPASILENTPFRSASISLVGRNLGYLQRNTDGFSPEAANFNVANNSLGMESASFPMSRQFGFNLNLGL